MRAIYFIIKKMISLILYILEPIVSLITIVKSLFTFIIKVMVMLYVILMITGYIDLQVSWIGIVLLMLISFLADRVVDFIVGFFYMLFDMTY